MSVVTMYGFDDTVGEPNVTLGGTSAYIGTSRTGAGGCLALGSAACTATFTAGTTRVVGFGMVSDSYATATSFFALLEGATVHLSLRLDASNHVQLYRGDGTTLLATSTYVLPAVGVWVYFEVKAVINDTTGSVDVYADEVLIISVSATDTRNAGTSGAVDTARFTRLGASQGRVDDMYVDTTTVRGDLVVRTLLPSGDGDSSDFVGSDGNSVNNSLLVDEQNSSSADYVGTALTGKTDLYALTDLPSGYTPLATQVLTYAAKSDGGTPPVLKPVTKGDGGTVLEETAVTLSTTYQVFASAVRTTDPDGDALTRTNVNAMQVGVRSA